jgi:hypothetical protein
MDPVERDKAVLRRFVKTVMNFRVSYRRGVSWLAEGLATYHDELYVMDVIY